MEDIKFKERMKMFLWDLSPFRRMYLALKKEDNGKLSRSISSIFLTLFVISVILLYLEKYSVIKNIPLLTNVYTALTLFILFIFFSLLGKWKERSYIGNYRLSHGIINQGEIKRIKNQNEI